MEDGTNKWFFSQMNRESPLSIELFGVFRVTVQNILWVLKYYSKWPETLAQATDRFVKGLALNELNTVY